MIKSNIFLVQMGHNSRKLAIQAIEENYCDGLILSPADFKPEQNDKISEDVKNNNGLLLFDSQWYLPRSERPKLSQYDYFDNGGSSYDTSEANEEDAKKEFCKKVIAYNERFKTDVYISPSEFIDLASEVKLDRFKKSNDIFIECAKEENAEKPILVSLPISSETLIDKDQRSALLNKVTMLDVEGFYVSIQVNKDTAYPLSKAAEVIAIIDFLKELKNNGYYIILGHTHHVAMLFLTIGIDGFASGHWKNLRTFDIERWEVSEDKFRSSPKLNYYSTKLLNELRVDQDLDALYMADYDLSNIKSGSPYEDELFSTTPSLAPWTPRSSWDHYMWCCNEIVKLYEGKNLKERVEMFTKLITEAKELYDSLVKEVGILSQPSEQIYITWKNAATIIKNKYLPKED